MRRKFILLVFLIMGGMSIAVSESNFVPYENPTTSEEKNLTFDMQQNVNGMGFFASYRRMLMSDAVGTEGRFNNGVEAGSNAHGSGEVDSELLLYAESSYYNKTWINGAYDEDGEIIEDDEDAASIINTNETSNSIYSRISMPIGTGYYAKNAFAFDSRIDWSNWVKNRDAMNSISNEIQDASSLDLKLNAPLNTTTTGMKLMEDVVDGKARFVAVQYAGLPKDEEPEDGAADFVPGAAMKAWHSPEFVLDEEYTGTYHIAEDLTMKIDEDDSEDEDDWLPCCSGGFFDMNRMDIKARNVKGIFDCTCYQPPAT